MHISSSLFMPMDLLKMENVDKNWIRLQNVYNKFTFDGKDSALLQNKQTRTFYLETKKSSGWFMTSTERVEEEFECESELDFVTLVSSDQKVREKYCSELMHFSAYRGHRALIQTLLKDKKEKYDQLNLINDCGDDGHTPLMLASLAGHDYTVVQLYNLGAVDHNTNKQGKTAIELADQGEQMCADILRNRFSTTFMKRVLEFLASFTVLYCFLYISDELKNENGSLLTVPYIYFFTDGLRNFNFKYILYAWKNKNLMKCPGMSYNLFQFIPTGKMLFAFFLGYQFFLKGFRLEILFYSILIIFSVHFASTISITVEILILFYSIFSVLCYSFF